MTKSSKRLAGVNIPLFSLRSKKSLGIGEFSDLIPLIEWASQAGLKVIQLLPIHDTSVMKSDQDRSPYSILSAFALHPIYINLRRIAKDEEEVIEPFARALNTPYLDYGRTYFTKMELLKMLFAKWGEEDLSSKDFSTYFEKNREHLQPYAAFSSLRDKYQTSDFRKWGKYQVYTSLLAEEVCESYPVDFFYFVQYHLDKQMSEVADHAKRRRIQLKGDFPMGVHPFSVEAWRFYKYFRWDQSMGAPPDFYNVLGQNWGFPSYNWEKIKEEGFYWLKSRLEWMGKYFDILRLDHVLGYFRLWEVPIEEVRGLMGTFFPSSGYAEEELEEYGLDIERLTTPYRRKEGKRWHNQLEVKGQVEQKRRRERLYSEIEDRLFFYRHGKYHPRIDVEHTRSFQALSPPDQALLLSLYDFYYREKQEALWKKRGYEKLSYIQKNAKMEICAEDIGVIPSCVAQVLSDLKMLNLHVQRMPKSFDLVFEDPRKFPETCVCMPANHDMAPLRKWWREDPKMTKLYYHTILKEVGDPPQELTGDLAKQIIGAHLASKARYAIFLLQDLLAISEGLRHPNPDSEQINDPANSDLAWKWRMPLYIEELLLAKSFTEEIKQIIKESRR